MSNFIKSIKDGNIAPQQQQPRQKNPFEQFMDRFVNYLPWSLLGLLMLIGVTFYLFLPSGSTVIRPTPPAITQEDMNHLKKENTTDKKNQ